MMWDGDGWWILMWVWMAMFWVAVTAGCIWLARSFLGPSRSGRDALEILDRRLASGNIDVDEHGRLKAALAVPVTRSRGGALSGWIVAAMIAATLVAMLATGALAGGWDMWDHMGGMHGGGRDTSSGSVVRGGVDANVAIEGFLFQPGNLEVPVGATVTWTNEDSAAHDATSRNGDWQTERLSEGESDTLTFDRPGEYDYYCSIHPSMKARLVVR